MNVNREGISRPHGARDGELIIADHDMKMVDYVWRGVRTVAKILCIFYSIS